MTAIETTSSLKSTKRLAESNGTAARRAEPSLFDASLFDPTLITAGFATTAAAIDKQSTIYARNRALTVLGQGVDETLLVRPVDVLGTTVPTRNPHQLATASFRELAGIGDELTSFGNLTKSGFGEYGEQLKKNYGGMFKANAHNGGLRLSQNITQPLQGLKNLGKAAHSVCTRPFTELAVGGGKCAAGLGAFALVIMAVQVVTDTQKAYETFAKKNKYKPNGDFFTLLQTAGVFAKELGKNFLTWTAGALGYSAMYGLGFTVGTGVLAALPAIALGVIGASVLSGLTHVAINQVEQALSGKPSKDKTAKA
jgi:hypothetical protein